MTDLEKVVANASDAQLAQWAPTIANIATHNAYHIGEIVMVRKEQGACLILCGVPGQVAEVERAFHQRPDQPKALFRMLIFDQNGNRIRKRERL